MTNGNGPAPMQKRRRRVMTKFNTEATQIRELTADELDFVSGGETKKTAKPKEQPLPYLVVTMEDVIITGVQ
jgi:hypothetical protein